MMESNSKTMWNQQRKGWRVCLLILQIF